MHQATVIGVTSLVSIVLALQIFSVINVKMVIIFIKVNAFQLSVQDQLT